MSHLTVWLIAFAITAIPLSLAVCFLIRRYRYWLAEGRKYRTQPVYVPPKPNFAACLLRSLVGRLAAFAYVGPVRIHNKRFLADRRRLLIVVNHQTERDAVVMTRVIGRRRLRYLIALNQVTASRAIWVAFTSGIAVDANAPGSVVRSTASTLAKDRNSSLMIFPEGELHPDGELKRENFHNGAIAIGRLAQRLHSGKDRVPALAVLPVYIRYERDLSRASFWQRLLLALGLNRYRLFFGERTYGCDVYLAEPRDLNLLPESTDEATSWVFEQICALQKSSRNHRVS